MEFNDDQDRGSDRPIFGAIFMANRTTKKECLKRKLFGLPLPQANFVKKIKSGMMLFLFEHEERQLYGVFQASSDGAMNIIPRAFTSSGKQFPAQIRVKQIWHCKPLSERDFRPAIRNNYYAGNKFNFALSKHQVSKLLLLFESRKIKPQTSKSPFSRDRVVVRPMVSNPGRVGYGDDRPIISDFGGIGHEDDRHMNSDFGRVGYDDDEEYIPSDTSNRDPGLSSNLNIFGGQFTSPYETSNSALRGETSIGLNVSNSSQAYPAYPMRSEDCLFPTRRSQVIPFDIDQVKPEPLPMTFGSTNLTSSFEDYIPLDPQSHFQPPISSRYKNENSPYLEPEPYSTTYPSLWRAGFGRENVSSSSSPGKDPPYVPDHHYPSALGHLGFRRENERSSFSPLKDPPYVPDHQYPSSLRQESFGREKERRPSFSPVKDPPYVPESPLYSNYESHSPKCTKPMEPDRLSDVKTDVGLRSDAQKTRISAFHRLKNLRNDTPKEKTECVSPKEDEDMSVDELMEMLCKRQKLWKGPTIKTQENIYKRKATENSFKIKNTPRKCEDDEALVLECDNMVVEEPPINFKRRSKTSKMNEGSESLSNTPAVPKRRKLLRPKLEPRSGDSEALVSSNKDEENNSEKKSDIEGGRISVQSMDVKEREESQNSSIQSVVLPVPSEQNRDNKSEIFKKGDESNENNSFQNCDKKSEIPENELVGNCDVEQKSVIKEEVAESGDLKAKVEAAIKELRGIKDLSVNQTQEAMQ